MNYQYEVTTEKKMTEAQKIIIVAPDPLYVLKYLQSIYNVSPERVTKIVRKDTADDRKRHREVFKKTSN